jgi:hypothetical protein
MKEGRREKGYNQDMVTQITFEVILDLFSLELSLLT